MTVTSTTAKSGPYNGNDSTTVFDYTFYIADEDELKVTLTDEDGVDTIQTLTTHYSVTIGDDGTGTFTMVTPPATGEKVTATLDVDLTQETDLVNYGAFFAQTHEDAFDKLTRLIQQLSEKVDRCLKLGQSETSDPEDVTLANFTQQAYLDTSNFTGPLDSSDTSIQTAFESLDTNGFGLVLISEVTSGTVRDLAFTSGDYDRLLIELNNVKLVSAGGLRIAFSYDSGSSWDSNINSAVNGLDCSDGGSIQDHNATSAYGILLSENTGESSGADPAAIYGDLTVYPGIYSPAEYTRYTGSLVYLSEVTTPISIVCGGYGDNLSINLIRISAETGNIASGTVRLWGLPKGS